MKKLTTKQLTEEVNMLKGAMQGFVNLFNAYIIYKGEGKGFSKFVKERQEKQKEAK